MEAASFRDPSGFVFRQDGQLYRQINPRYREEYDRLMDSGLGRDLIAKGWLIPHEEVGLARPGAYRVIRPEPVPFISYPYEWSFSQLKDAAMLTLKIQRRALKSGLTLKDASAYNVQFWRGRPVFIDTLSFEVYQEGRPWVAYRQFCQHFLAPLALMAHTDVRLNQLARVYIDGVPLDLASRLLPWRTRLRPSLAVHLHVHARTQKKYAGQGAQPAASRPLSMKAHVGLLENLGSVIQGLSWRPAGTEWADYYDNTNYSTDALSEKERLVSGLLDKIRPGSVWDLGANTGKFSRLASARQIQTVSFDLDPAAVEKHYLDVRHREDAHVLPLLLDLSNPSPALGWANIERQSVAARGPVDAVLALALIHHLAIGNNIPLGNVAEFFATLTRDLIIEFVPKVDSQVQRLLVSREDIFDDYTESRFEDAFARRFSLEQKLAITGTSRVLYHFRRR